MQQQKASCVKFFRVYVWAMITPKNIRDRATKAHMTIEALMRKAHVERSTFWRWENGIGKPHPVTVQKISDALDAIEAEKAQAA